MNHFSIFMLATLVFSASSFADGDHTPDVCSTADKEVCAHIGHMSGMKTKVEGKFLVHITAPKIENFKMDLWMPDHKHGTSPVTVTPKGKNKFEITKAEFSMPGKWHARLTFDSNKKPHAIEIPLDIKE